MCSQRKLRAHAGAVLVAVFACATVATIAPGAGAGEPPAAAAHLAQAGGSVDPTALSQQVSALADSTAGEWSAHELARGGFDDPVVGPVVGDYGVSMIGEALVEAGVAGGSDTLVDDGLTAELSEITHADEGGFELLSLSDAYSYDESTLAGNPAWKRARPRLARFLRRHGPPISKQGLCYASAHCYTNLKLVSAVAELALLHTGLRGYRSDALLGNPAGVRDQTRAWLRMAVGHAGSGAYRVGDSAFSGVGILSDPSENPLAYHVLSTLMLGRAMLALGARTPPALGEAFGRTAEALVGLLAPDGDDTYIGRGQAQVWSVAATIDALAIAAELTTDATWRGRYLSAAAVALQRLQSLYPSSGWGFPLVPRFAGDNLPTSYTGIDRYANTVEYDGLALWALDDAATQLHNAPAAAEGPLPSESDGAFVDPSHTRFAAVTHGDLWFAVHAVNSNHGDARYGFGLVAAELDTVDGWRAALPQRPLTRNATLGGLAMLSGRATLYPVGRSISASSTGVVAIVGSWRDARRTVDRGMLWTFAPTASGNGVALSFAAKPGSAYALQVWYEAGARLSPTRHGVTIEEPDGSSQSYLLNVRVHIAASVTASSAYSENLHSLVLTIPATTAARQISYTTTMLTAAATTPGAAGPSGASGPSGETGSSARSGASGSSGEIGASGSG
ncbi:MAG TPA: hypothetical protein VHM72_10600 [Solirubrobacteraceae bacterium]|nr:hypothetical protein [Solirubrobacteraceae bacterium]